MRLGLGEEDSEGNGNVKLSAGNVDDDGVVVDVVVVDDVVVHDDDDDDDDVVDGDWH